MTILLNPNEVDDDGNLVVDIEEAAPPPDALTNIFGELGVDNANDVIIKVYRINEHGKEAHCFDTPPGGLDGIEERLRDAYGRGDYKLKAFGPTPQGKKSLKKVAKLTIETPMEKDAASVSNSGDDIRQIVAQMTETVMKAQAENASTLAQAQLNMMQMFKEQSLESQLKMQEMMIQFMGNKSDIHDQIALVKSLIPEQPNPVEMMNTMFEMNTKAQEMFTPQPQTPLGELSSGINSLVKLAANSPKNTAGSSTKPEASTVVQAVNAQQPPQQPPQQAQQPQQPQQPLRPEEMKLSNPFVRHQIKQYIPQLLQQASENTNPELIAEFVVDKLPGDFYPVLLELVGEDDKQLMSNLNDLEPSCAVFAEWFGLFAAHIRLMFSEADDVINEMQSDLDQPNSLNDENISGDNVAVELDDNQPDALSNTNKANTD